jgi:transcriptional regulator
MENLKKRLERLMNMYIPEYFKINDKEIIYEVIEKNSFATLFSQHNGEPYATHLPLTLNRENDLLYGHFALQNEQWKDIESQKVLVTFQGPHCYISPSWYETNKAVPTWNYVAIHVYGHLKILENKQEIFHSLQDMVSKYEEPNSSYNLNDIDPTYIEGMSRGIVGFKIEITKMEGKMKLSQNHSIERKKLIIKSLEDSTDQNNKEIADLMEKNLM